MLVFSVKELIWQHIANGSSMYITMLDVYKAFDKVYHCKLFGKLITMAVLLLLYTFYTIRTGITLRPLPSDGDRHLHQSQNPLFINYFHTDIHFVSSIYKYWTSKLYTWYLYCTLFLIIIFNTYSNLSWLICINFIIYLFISLLMYLMIVLIIIHVLYFSPLQKYTKIYQSKQRHRECLCAAT